MVFSGFKSGIFSITPIEGTGCPDMLDRVAHVTKVFDRDNRSHLKILNPKQMLQGLPIALAQVEAGNTSANLLINKIRQMIFFFFCIEQRKLLKKYTTI